MGGRIFSLSQTLLSCQFYLDSCYACVLRYFRCYQRDRSHYFRPWKTVMFTVRWSVTWPDLRHTHTLSLSRNQNKKNPKPWTPIEEEEVARFFICILFMKKRRNLVTSTKIRQWVKADLLNNKPALKQHISFRKKKENLLCHPRPSKKFFASSLSDGGHSITNQLRLPNGTPSLRLLSGLSAIMKWHSSFFHFTVDWSTSIYLPFSMHRLKKIDVFSGKLAQFVSPVKAAEEVTRILSQR